MEFIGFLICFPLIVAVLLLFIRNNAVRRVVVYTGGIIIGVVSIWVVIKYLGTEGEYFTYSNETIDLVCSLIDLVISLIIIAYGIRYKRVLAIILALIQLAMSCVFSFGGFESSASVEQSLYIDSLSLLMVGIIGVVGSGICIYALGYMEDHQRLHQNVKDRRPLFFALMFSFLSAMYVIVFVNNMAWLFTGWEYTTLCSFLLIGYNQDELGINNSFRQIVLNMIGGITFCAALFYSSAVLKTLSLAQFIQIGVMAPSVVFLPLVLLSISGFTKAAQMPFQSWLLGAMVAPTPTSALLHSSTMVKAGAFLLVRLAPIYAVSEVPSLMVVLVGGITFCLCSFMGISQTITKRVLAYSTIANLGLIVACAGVGTAEAVWAAEFLILFHAVAKSLLFLCMGTCENHIGSRDIEKMDLMFQRMPRLTRYMMLGIMIMFIAPFGMLIAKWGTLVSFLTGTYPQIVLIILLAFGSAATFMFWAKWLGKLSGIAGNPDSIESTVHSSEWFGIVLMAVLSMLCCVFMPAISDYVVEPYLLGVYGTNGQAISSDNLWICAICTVFVIVVLFGTLTRGTKKKQVGVYLSGISADNDGRMFVNSMSGSTKAEARNWYLDDMFGETRFVQIGVTLNIVLMFVPLVLALAELTTLL
ncbi:MAG: NADH-quinone oxidoreductase subunit L [Eggerthellaceae bacterium]